MRHGETDIVGLFKAIASPSLRRRVSPSLLLFVAPGVSRQLMMTAAFCILPTILAGLLFFHINLHFLAFSKFFSRHFQNIASPGLRTTLPPSLPALSCRAPSCSRVAEASSSQRCRCNSSYYRLSNERSTSGEKIQLSLFSHFSAF